jgi:hypothetical protein
LEISHLDGGWEAEPYDLFLYGISSVQTKEKYVTRMKEFSEIIGIDPENRLTIHG